MAVVLRRSSRAMGMNAAAKALGGLIALALVRPGGRVVRRSWLLVASAAASVLLIVYGGLNVAAGALVLRVSCILRGAWTGRPCAGMPGFGTCGSWCGGSC